MSDSVAVIIPTRSRNHLLTRAVTSVLLQDYPAVSIIVVDDNLAQDRVRSALKGCNWLNDPRVKVVENDWPLNASRARNIGLGSTDASWIAYLDDDDEYCPQKISSQVSICLERKVHLALCGYCRELPLRRRILQTQTEVYRGVELYRDAHPGTPFLIHRNADTLRFDESLDAHEDADFFYRAIAYFKASEVHVATQPLVIVHQQLGTRVNIQSAPSRRAQCVIYCRHFRCLPRPVRRLLLVRILLSRWKQGGTRIGFCRIFFWLWRFDRWGALRSAANAVLFRTPFLRRFAVS
jgi:glycosyltransferase involved in cell wall biosynthesis